MTHYIFIMKSYSEYKQTTNKHTAYLPVVEIPSMKLVTSDVSYHSYNCYRGTVQTRRLWAWISNQETMTEKSLTMDLIKQQIWVYYRPESTRLLTLVYAYGKPASGIEQAAAWCAMVHVAYSRPLRRKLPIRSCTLRVQWLHDRWRHVNPKVKVVTPISLKLNISKNVRDRRSVQTDHLWYT